MKLGSSEKMSTVHQSTNSSKKVWKDGRWTAEKLQWVTSRPQSYMKSDWKQLIIYLRERTAYPPRYCVCIVMVHSKGRPNIQISRRFTPISIGNRKKMKWLGETRLHVVPKVSDASLKDQGFLQACFDEGLSPNCQHHSRYKLGYCPPNSSKGHYWWYSCQWIINSTPKMVG